MKMKIETVSLNWKVPKPPAWHEVPGNECSKRAVEIALAGPCSIALVAMVNSPASDLLRATAALAEENELAFNGHVLPVCPCGCFGSPRHECTCDESMLKEHARSMSAFRRCAIFTEVCEPSLYDMRTSGREQASMLVKRVRSALGRKPVVVLDSESEDMLRLVRGSMSYDRSAVVSVAGAISRLSFYDCIRANHVAEALMYQRNPVFEHWVDDAESVSVGG